MRKLSLAPAFAVLLAAAPLAALAQPATAPATSGAPATASETMTRDQFLARATDRAGRMFDAIDVNHTGSVTGEQVRAYMHAHHGQRMQPPQ